MSTNINKGIYPIAIYEFIKNNSDVNKHIFISDIVNHLKNYAGGIEDSSIKRTVERHIDGIIQYDENVHVILKNNEEGYIPAETTAKEIKEIYYDQPFSSNDIRILSDAVIFSKHLKNKERLKLLEKLSKLMPSHSNNWYNNAVHESIQQAKIESDLFRNLEYIDQAIAEKKCIKFDKMVFGINKKLHTSESCVGFSPYYIFIANQTYYVIGVFDIRDFNKKHIYPVSLLEVYRMKKLSFDHTSVYVDINKTSLNGKSLKDICDMPFDIYACSDRLNLNISENVKFEISAKGMNVIIPIWRNNLTITKINPEDKTYNKKISITPTEERYIATLKVASRADWNTILSLLNSYSILEIALISHHETLQKIINKMSYNFKPHIDGKRVTLHRTNPT